MSKLTHDDLVRRALVFLRRRRCVIYGTEVNATAEIPDAIGWTCWGDSIVVECKTSRSDFMADFKKPHRAPGKGMGQERYYLAPAGLLDSEEMPDGWGLIEAQGRRTVELAKATKREEWNRHSDTLALLHLARRACDYTPANLHRKIEEERAEQRRFAQAARERQREFKARNDRYIASLSQR